ncbi:MAG: methylenetetrahydrofolate reductase C-terminal domain-containing protein [Candidatus Omnitrophica bacterium]|nr:methylenetetrahydrofolate reductase C-terminal domain-containing protein [Candidatus Omnitrophota bacterium]MCM8829249.1 methylenetetrahydrofolate reductase C-terminal domain-containing protein [Candidatus Omnitrophota bacterium]
MLYTEMKDFEEIKKLLESEESVFLLGCGGCAEVCRTSDEKTIVEIEEKLKNSGKSVSGKLIIDFMCSKQLLARRLARFQDDLDRSTAILVFSCGIGIQCAGAVSDKVVYPATNTISLGGFQGLWPGEERCAQCGTCYLGITDGICPITFCAKELVNGACGGAKDGMCEIKTEKECGWVLIYERLKKIGKLDLLREIQQPRDFKKIEPDAKLRKTIHFAIDR